VKIARFLSPSGPRLGLVTDEGVHDLPAIAQAREMAWAAPMFSDIRLFVLGGGYALELVDRLTEWSGLEPLPEHSLKVLAPFEATSKILAHVVNYWEHGKEAGLAPPESPFFFYKPPSSVVNPGDPIIAHEISSKMDHEVELAAIIGRVARNVSAECANEYIAGYTVVNDVSYRDFQMIEQYPTLAKRYGKNWTQGKGLDHACPMGPYLITSDALPNPYPLEIRCTVNGDVRQQSDTGRMIFKLPALIADVSRSMTLYPGDIISTGTCEGGGVGSGVWLKPGDEVECYVQNVGTLRNRVVAPRYAR
jgi:2-keto-4-pentenoate hydratase/2-oxohepta-3-ene-1,7-dioic acid hydratase in catechol pathway